MNYNYGTFYHCNKELKTAIRYVMNSADYILIPQSKNLYSLNTLCQVRQCNNNLYCLNRHISLRIALKNVLFHVLTSSYVMVILCICKMRNYMNCEFRTDMTKNKRQPMLII